ncbi:hypothetical protein BDF22DRAFT_774948 [Syncephalis plumigaleata]|nr:hypothetical protein BDF22DRAFT_774948 [Syncephalis plumigaleata]
MSTTTEISSNSNSSCRLLDCMNTLPFQDQRVFRSLLGHIELVRLSACCRSLSSIRDDPILWQQLYHSDFLSGAYYVKEMEFVLWCVRTDVNNPCTSDKRADLLENVDWYNTYRRRVSTENNWRYGRYNTTRIDMEADEDGVRYREDVNDNRVFITRQARSDETSGHNYTLEYLPHPNLRASNNIMYNSTFSTSPNVLFLSSNNGERHTYFFSDYYIAQSHKIPKNNTSHGIMLRSRKQNSAVNTFSAPMAHQVESIQEKWMLLIAKSPGLLGKSYIPRINNSIMCPGSIDDTWDATCFYKTTNDTATLYTARLVKDDTDRIEWALYQFSSNNPVVQLRIVLAATPSASPAAPATTNTNSTAPTSTDVTPPCANVESVVTSSKTLAAVCAAPIDGSSGHFCSLEQINKALDAMEAHCQTELKDAQRDVQDLYADWLTYSLNANTYCMKAPNSNGYCMEEVTNNRTQSSADSNDANALAWKPPRSQALAGESFTSRMDSIKQSAKDCKIAVNNATNLRQLSMISVTNVITIGIATATATTATTSIPTTNDTHLVKQRLAFMGDISEACRTALDNASMPFANALPQLCHMPADGQPRHPCSREQISTALTTMDKECGNELKSNEDKVVDIYETCNSTGQEYCVLRNNSLPTLPRDISDIDELECDTCITTSVTTMLEWKPPVTPPAHIAERTNQAMTMLRQLHVTVLHPILLIDHYVLVILQILLRQHLLHLHHLHRSIHIYL